MKALFALITTTYAVAIASSLVATDIRADLQQENATKSASIGLGLLQPVTPKAAEPDASGRAAAIAVPEPEKASGDTALDYLETVSLQGLQLNGVSLSGQRVGASKRIVWNGTSTEGHMPRKGG